MLCRCAYSTLSVELAISCLITCWFIQTIERIARFDGDKNWQNSFMEKLMQMLAEDIHAQVILIEPVSLSTKTELSHLACGIEKSTKISLPVVR